MLLNALPNSGRFVRDASYVKHKVNQNKRNQKESKSPEHFVIYPHYHESFNK